MLARFFGDKKKKNGGLQDSLLGQGQQNGGDGVPGEPEAQAFAPVAIQTVRVGEMPTALSAQQDSVLAEPVSRYTKVPAQPTVITDPNDPNYAFPRCVEKLEKGKPVKAGVAQTAGVPLKKRTHTDFAVRGGAGYRDL